MYVRWLGMFSRPCSTLERKFVYCCLGVRRILWSGEVCPFLDVDRDLFKSSSCTVCGFTVLRRALGLCSGEPWTMFSFMLTPLWSWANHCTSEPDFFTIRWTWRIDDYWSSLICKSFWNCGVSLRIYLEKALLCFPQIWEKCQSYEDCLMLGSPCFQTWHTKYTVNWHQLVSVSSH